MKVREGFIKWLADAGRERKPGTQKYYGEICKIILNRWLDHEQETDDVTEQQVSDFILLVAHYSPPRFNAILSAVKAVIRVARLKNSAGDDVFRWRPVPTKERANLTQLQFNTLLRELDDRPRSHSGLIVDFLAHTGLRIAAARQLKWCDVHADYILAPARIMKNGKPCMIPFVTGTAEILERLRAITGKNKSGLVLPSSSVKTALKRACRVLNLPHLSHHDFRHLFATRCICSGVDVPTVARWLSHQDGGALLGRVYFHLADNHSRQMARRVEI